jgi:hypothetical protein
MAQQRVSDPTKAGSQHQRLSVLVLTPRIVRLHVNDSFTT